MPIPDHHQLRNMYAVVILALPALLNFATLKFQGSPNSPFETHPITVFSAIFALLLYCSLSLQSTAHPLHYAAAWDAGFYRLLRILSFYFSIALPTSLLFPGPTFFLLHLLVLILTYADRLYGLVRALIRPMRQEIPPFVFVRQLLGGRAPPLLPITVADAHHARESVVPAGVQLAIVMAQEENL